VLIRETTKLGTRLGIFLRVTLCGTDFHDASPVLIHSSRIIHRSKATVPQLLMKETHIHTHKYTHTYTHTHTHIHIHTHTQIHTHIHTYRHTNTHTHTHIHTHNTHTHTHNTHTHIHTHKNTHTHTHTQIHTHIHTHTYTHTYTHTHTHTHTHTQKQRPEIDLQYVWGESVSLLGILGKNVCFPFIFLEDPSEMVKMGVIFSPQH